FGELFPAPGEHLDAIVVVRIVRRRYDNPQIEAVDLCQVGNSRCRHDTDPDHAGPFTASARGEIGFQPLAGLAGVPPDQDARRTSVVGKRTHEGGTYSTDRRMVERIFAGRATHTVGPEQSWYRRISL